MRTPSFALTSAMLPVSMMLWWVAASLPVASAASVQLPRRQVALVAGGESVSLVIPIQTSELSNGCSWTNYDQPVLDCSGVGLVEPPGRGIMRTATHIWLDHNGIAEVFVGSFAGLSQTSMLFLDNNAITAVAVGAFNDMAVLSVLSLAYNSIARFPDGMVRLHELQILDLSSNQIRVLPRRSLPSYSNKLRWLNMHRNSVSFINCGFFPSGAGLNYLQMQANPSQCEVDKTTGAIACRCKRAELTGPGFCQRECDVVELNLGPPINNLDTSELLVGVSWSRVAEMLGDFRANLTKVLEAHREAGRKDGTHIIANAAGDNSSDADEGTGVSHGTIAALVSVAGFAVAAVVVINIQRIRETRDLAASSVSSGSVIGGTDDDSSAYDSSKSTSTLVPFVAKAAVPSHGLDDGTYEFDRGSYNQLDGTAGCTIPGSETCGDHTDDTTDDTTTESSWTKRVSAV